MFKKATYFFSLLLTMTILVFPVFSQPLQRVTHTTGTQMINDINVTVTSKGMIANLGRPTYCDGNTGPYYMGYNTRDYSCATGSYTFTFNPPVAFVNLNFSGLSTSEHYDEEAIIEVNGHHYPLTEMGKSNNCEDLAALNKSGNLTGCNDCSASGTNGIKVEGPIYTLTITDSVLFGEPAGILFGIWMSYVSLEVDLGSKVCAYKKESASGSALIIEGNEVDLKLISVSGPTGEKSLYYSYSQDPAISIDITTFTKGAEYTFEFLVNDQLISKKLTIW
jgi:hypothetical protein